MSIETVFNRVNHAVQEYFRTGIYILNPVSSIIDNIFQIRKFKPGLYHITGDISYVAILLCNKKVVLTIHDIGHYKNLKGLKKWIYGWIWVRLPVYYSKKVTVVSDYTKQDLQKHFLIDSEKVIVVHNPLGEKFIHHPAIFNKLEPKILVVGTAIHKNVENIIKAVEGVNCILVIIGHLSGSLLARLQSLQVRFEIYDKLNEENLLKEYIKSDMLVFVSKHEGFGMPVIEAQAIGRPVITSAICALPEVAGEKACFVDNPDNYMEIREKIVEVIENDYYRDQLITHGLINVRRFHSEIIAQQYAAVYNPILHK